MVNHLSIKIHAYKMLLLTSVLSFISVLVEVSILILVNEALRTNILNGRTIVFYFTNVFVLVVLAFYQKSNFFLCNIVPLVFEMPQ